MQEKTISHTEQETTSGNGVWRARTPALRDYRQVGGEISTHSQKRPPPLAEPPVPLPPPITPPFLPNTNRAVPSASRQQTADRDTPSRHTEAHSSEGEARPSPLILCLYKYLGLLHAVLILQSNFRWVASPNGKAEHKIHWHTNTPIEACSCHRIFTRVVV